MRVEVVRGGLDDSTAQRLVEFWTAHGALDEAAARERLPQVVCVLYDEAGEIAGVNSVYAADAPLVGRQFWIYRRFLAPAGGIDAELAMLGSAYEALAQDFEGGEDEPLGLCVLVADRVVIEAASEAVWPDVDFVYAGYSRDGRQVRIRYFEGAMI